MRTNMTLEDIKASLSRFLDSISPCDEVILTLKLRYGAKLTGEPPLQREPRWPGNCKGIINLLVEEDEHLDGFAGNKQAVSLTLIPRSRSSSPVRPHDC